MTKNAHMHGPHSIMPGGGYTHTVPIAMGLYKMCVGCVKAGPVIAVCGVARHVLWSVRQLKHGAHETLPTVGVPVQWTTEMQDWNICLLTFRKWFLEVGTHANIPMCQSVCERREGMHWCVPFRFCSDVWHSRHATQESVKCCLSVRTHTCVKCFL